ncbi:MAG: DUF3142 domain-containing protein, partial [Pyrinomonadaceae bacterium]
MWLWPAGILLVVTISLGWRAAANRPRAWAAGEAPLAFWHWRNETPSAALVAQAARQTNARVLFLRAGQFDDEGGGNLRRIRPAVGRVPDALPLHLTYNATRTLLASFERIEETELASLFAETYRTDAARAASDGARVVGAQLDLDVPTRLLPRYTRVLRHARKQLPPDTQLSITGLPTW